MLRALFLLLLMALFAVPLPAAAAGGAFVAGTEDVPLMPGLKPIDNAGLVFDKPQGRIVEAQAHGKVTRAAVRRFYETTLPQLGWTADGGGGQSWRREGERLRIDIRGRDGDVRVGFTLSPQ